MPLPLLLLLVLLGPSLQQIPADGDEDDLEDYDEANGTDPPDTLETITAGVTLSPELQAAMGTLGQRESAGPGSPEPATPEVTTGDSGGLDARGAAPGKLSMELTSQGVPVTPGPLTTDLGTTIPPITEAPSTEGAPSTELATTEALPTEPLTTQPAAMEALSTEPLTTQLAAMEALTTEPLTTQPAATEALSTEPATTAAPPTEPTTTETLSKEPATMKALSTRGLSTAFLVLSDPHEGTTVAASNSSDAFIKQGKSSQGLSPPSSASPSLTKGPDYMPVKHCLLAILILALVATTFLVCTVVLAVRLSRRNHMYHVRSYSPTEMVCISSLLPEGGEAPAATPNGSLPTAKGPGLLEGPGEDHNGDDLTLHSFLP
ncbi:PREDICTED: P-selectin glycoprotein ligand 1 isoform X3 [Myotis brandtii]|uniref:P-selectin glycoprotein ligand 1 isoform X3 n=1 Tax=Myotis brandtii TaxID=109478 RepID=UPI000704165F|nr:PREDICTED: P-selectin glycoprotein ligand 1 isoform X3 [Myotis brandtii]